MSQPTDYPDWATDDPTPTNKVKPASGRVAAGWDDNQKPPAKYFNWWKNLVGKWVRYLESVDTALSNQIGNLRKYAEITDVASDIVVLTGLVTSIRVTTPAGSNTALTLNSAGLANGSVLLVANSPDSAHNATIGAVVIIPGATALYARLPAAGLVLLGVFGIDTVTALATVVSQFASFYSYMTPLVLSSSTVDYTIDPIDHYLVYAKCDTTEGDVYWYLKPGVDGAQVWINNRSGNKVTLRKFGTTSEYHQIIYGETCHLIFAESDWRELRTPAPA